MKFILLVCGSTNKKYFKIKLKGVFIMMTESVARKSNVDVGEKICRRAYSVNSNKDDFVQIRISTD